MLRGAWIPGSVLPPYLIPVMSWTFSVLRTCAFQNWEPGELYSPRSAGPGYLGV